MLPLFDGNTAPNQGAFLRRIALCNLELGNAIEARNALESLPAQQKSVSITIYVEFCVELKYSSDEIILKVAKKLTDCDDFRVPMLYYCAVKAQECKKPSIELSLLDLILSMIDQGRTPEKLQIPTLLRCAISLIALMKDSRDFEIGDTERVCQYFERAASLVAKPDLVIVNGFNSRELDWFSKNCFNLVLLVLSKWAHNHTSRLLVCCKQVILKHVTICH